MASINIKELASNYFKNRLNLTLEDVEKLLQDVYDEGKEDGEILERARFEAERNNFEFPIIWKHSITGETTKWDGKMWVTESEENKSINPQPHYDNSKGSLYKVAQDRNWNAYQFDIVKRIDRALKKGQFKEDLQKTKDLIDIWLKEYDCTCGENECCSNC